MRLQSRKHADPARVCSGTPEQSRLQAIRKTGARHCSRPDPRFPPGSRFSALASNARPSACAPHSLGRQKNSGLSIEILSLAPSGFRSSPSRCERIACNTLESEAHSCSAGRHASRPYVGMTAIVLAMIVHGHGQSAGHPTALDDPAARGRRHLLPCAGLTSPEACSGALGLLVGIILAMAPRSPRREHGDDLHPRAEPRRPGRPQPPRRPLRSEVVSGPGCVRQRPDEATAPCHPGATRRGATRPPRPLHAAPAP